MTLKALRVPASMLALASFILVPAFSASASEGKEQRGECLFHPPAIAFEIETIAVSDDDGSGTITGSLVKVPDRLTEETGADDGDSITISFTAETKFMKEGEETTVDAFEAGDVAFALGNIDFESMNLDARAIVDKPRPRPHFHIAEVVEVDTDANTILVKSVRPNLEEEGEETKYVLVSYDDETSINEDAEAADESAISVGDKIHAHGLVTHESDEYFAEVDAEHILLWDETEPRRPTPLKGPRGPLGGAPVDGSIIE